MDHIRLQPMLFHHPAGAAFRKWRKKGFALVVTLSLMVLLTIVAVGLLGLSAVSLRSADQNNAQSIARANARMALMLAIGELQKYAGPDRAITATSEIYATGTNPVAKPNTTGVWESWWDFDPSNSPNYQTQKTSRFRRWLVSGSDMTAVQNPNFVTNAWTGDTIELVGKGSLGTTSNAAKATAGLVAVNNNGKVRGSYGWHVADESVKARINYYRDPNQKATLAQKRALLAGHRPDPSVIKGSDGSLMTFFPSDLTDEKYTKAIAGTGKIIDINQAELLDNAKGKIRPLRNDITTYSMGVMSDVRGGGLKQDLSSIFETSNDGSRLPSDFNRNTLYKSTHGITGVSDPSWNALAAYYNSFRNLSAAESSPIYVSKSGNTYMDPVPSTFNPMPVIAKVDTIFSLVSRPLTDIHWTGDTRNVWDYFVDLIFTPVVTLHNPYNVNVSFYKMKVTFQNLPVAFNFMFQAGGSGPFVSQSVNPGTFESLNTMAYNSNPKVRGDKLFMITIADWSDANLLDSNSTINGPITLKPGQTLICGPIFPPDASLAKDSVKGKNTIGFDWENDLTNNVKAIPKFTPGLGFELYHDTIGHIRYKKNSTYNGSGPLVVNTAYYPGGWGGHPFMMLRDLNASPKISKSSATDQFYIEYKVQRPGWYDDDTTTRPALAAPNFEVTAQIQATATDGLVDFAKLRYDYKDDSTLNKVFNNKVFRYPPTGSLTGSQTAAPPGNPYSAQATFVRPFAIFSAYSRTTNGGVYETGKRVETSGASNLLQDGRLAGKPFLFHNSSRTNFVMDLTQDKPGVQSYELNFQPFLSKGNYEDYMDVDSTNRVPSLSGNRTSTGIKSGSYLELPSGPLQTIADFRRSNALATSYLPSFVQPVANSLPHPLMSTDKVVERNATVAPTYDLLDHSVLANHALYDRFYFSTFATRGNTKPATVFEQFMNGTAPLASQAFQPYQPGGVSAAAAKSELFDSSGVPKDTAYKLAAEYQMVRGPFNVNSTSVQAWKAVLASMNNSDIAILWARTAALESMTAKGVPIMPMSLVNNTNIIPGPVGNEIDRSNNWNGYRLLTDAELESLAVRIVDEVRTRGPFLSMSEFVNRQVGSSGPLTLGGALESAIAKSEINEKENSGNFLSQAPITTADVSDTRLYNYKTPEATIGNPAAGAPGWVNQGDLLRILEPAATVRGDTFVIRSYGEAKDANGKVSARAYAEAVVQRVPDYVDPADRPSLNAYTDTTARTANKTFGRRFNLVSFRWLTKEEV